MVLYFLAISFGMEKISILLKILKELLRITALRMHLVLIKSRSPEIATSLAVYIEQKLGRPSGLGILQLFRYSFPF